MTNWYLFSVKSAFFGLKASNISGLIRTQWSEIRFVLMIIWKCGIKSPKRPKVSSKYCDYFNKVSVFKYLNICLWLSEYLSLNICLSLFTKTLEVFWSIFDSFRPAFILIRWPRMFFSGRSLVMISFKFPASGSLPVIFISLVEYNWCF